MSRRSVNGDDLDLSLTGSQIATPSSGRRPGSGRPLKRPNSLVDIRCLKDSSVKNGGSLSGARDKKSSPRGGVSAPVSHRSDVSGASVKNSRRTGMKECSQSEVSKDPKGPPDDFLAFFEPVHQPKIKKPAGSTLKPRKIGHSAVKLGWDAPHPKKPSTPTASARSGGTQSARTLDTERSDQPRNIFCSNVDDNSSDDLDGIEDSLSRSLSKLQSLQNQLSEVNKNNSSTEDHDVINSHRSPRSAPRKNMNSIVNNMTTHGQSTKAKTALSSIENSYQNIKPKVPVNQVRKSASNQVGMNVAEDYIQTLNSAAVKIQNWFRRHHRRKVVSEAAIRRMLEQKKKDHLDKRQQELAMSQSEHEIEEQRVEDRKRLREEKARQARQQAIQELQKKRAEKREDAKNKSEEEIAYLQASGKITKSPSKTSLAKKKKASGSKASAAEKSEHSPRNTADEHEVLQSRNGRSNCVATPEIVDEIFESQSTPRQNGAEAASPDVTPRLRSPSQADTRTTLNDLFDTLKKLEEEENFETSRAEKKMSWLTEFEKRKDKEDWIESNLTAENLEKLNSKGGLKQSGFLSDGKLKSIMSFLDEVQVSDRLSEIDTEINKMNEELEKPVLAQAGEESAQMEQAQAMATEVTNTVLSQRLELEEKRRTVTMLQKALNQQRELTVRHARETEKEMKKRLDVQKDEYEETVKRHLGFIDQLIDDKKNLSERCEQLVKELKVIDKKYQDKIKTMDDSHSREMTKLKDVHSAAEKLRREKWIEEKTKKIKEMTVKGLEPEIQRLIAKHKAEIKKIKQMQETDILDSDERSAQRYVKMMEDLREQLAHEKESAVARERQLAKDRYEKQLQQEEESYQQQRRRLHAEVQEEKDRLAQQASRQRIEVDKMQRQLEDSHKMALDAMKEEFEKAREEQDRRHTIEVRELKERLRLEKESWEENYMKKQETWLTQKERELKVNVRRDRDKEIELVIQRLEEDATKSREECERAAENRIKRMRDKFNNEMKELENSEREAVQKCNEYKARMTEMEGECERLKVIVRQKDQEVLDIKKLTSKMQEERGHVSDIIRQEFADRIVATEEENKRLKIDMSEVRAKHRLDLEKGKQEVEDIKRQKDEEMDEVHKRVKQAIVKKEEVVNQLRHQYQAATKRADHLEGLLEQQRKQLLGKKS